MATTTTYGITYNENEDCYEVWRCEDHKRVELIGSDGGEPEDASLMRDYSWVASALQEAYVLGMEHANENHQAMLDQVKKEFA